jgi:putative membrane protein
MHWDGGWGWGDWFGMVAMMLFAVALVAVTVIVVVRAGVSRPGVRRDAEDLLADRYARGEIERDEYADRLRTLRSARGS